MTQSMEMKILGDLKGEVGELRGKVGEINNVVNNMSQKLDGIYLKVADVAHLAKDVADLKTRVTALEDSENQRKGAVNFGAWLMKSPLVAWIAAAGLTVWAFLKGHGQ